MKSDPTRGKMMERNTLVTQFLVCWLSDLRRPAGLKWVCRKKSSQALNRSRGFEQLTRGLGN